MRKLSILLSIVFLISCFVVPVSASESFDNSFSLNVLDFNPDKLNVRTLTPTDNSVSFVLPSWITVRYVDSVFTITGSIPTSVSVKQGSTVSSLTISKVGSGLYRIYGTLTGSGNSLIFTFDSTGTFYVTAESMHAVTSLYTRSSTEAYCEIVSAAYNNTIHYVPTDPSNRRVFSAPSDFADSYFYCYIWSDNWKSYDYLDFQLMFNCFDITSVTAVYGSVNVPLDVSYINGTALAGNSYYLSMRMDLSGLDRTIDDYPMIVVMGRLDAGAVNGVDFTNCSGYVAVADINPLFIFLSRISASVSTGFSNLNSWISSQTSAIVSAINGDTSSGDSFQNEVNDKADELDQMAAVMDSVTKPPIDSINVSVNDYVSAADLTLLASPMTVFFSGDIYLPMMIMSILMATVSFVLFGKK